MRYDRIHTRTDEEKRKGNVDVERIPYLVAELESIRVHFRTFSLSEVSSAAYLINGAIQKLHLRKLYEQEDEERKLRQWVKQLSVDSLIRMSTDYSAPQFIRSGVEVNIAALVHSVIDHTERQLSDYRKRGVTNSILVSMFTSKVDVDTVWRWEQQKAEYLAYSLEIPKIEDAQKLLATARSQSAQYVNRVLQIEGEVALAIEKKGAVERFEKRFGKTFAKAAAVDKISRKRAAQIKGLVRKTRDCPYCGADLGSNPQLDHIYPVSMGGLSIVENLVWCCSACNAQKSDKGLAQFLAEQCLSIEGSLSRLRSLGKHV